MVRYIYDLIFFYLFIGGSMSTTYGSYFTEQVEGAMEDASLEGNTTSRLTFPGEYLMRVISRKYKKDNEFHMFPNIKPTDKTKALQLNFILEVVDGTDKVTAGTYDYGSLILAPAPGATEKKIKDTMNFLKPRLAALIGKEAMEKFKFNVEWVDEHLLAEFKKDGDEYVVKRNHKMTNLVMVKFEPDIYNNKVKLSITEIRAAKDGDKSITTGESIAVKKTVDGSEADHNVIESLAGGNIPEGVAEIDVF